jgi:hypothetical protein
VTRYRVADATQVHHDGVTYTGGQTLEATPGAAATWLSAGWVTEATGAKAVHREQVEDKATAPRRRSPRS